MCRTSKFKRTDGPNSGKGINSLAPNGHHKLARFPRNLTLTLDWIPSSQHTGALYSCYRWSTTQHRHADCSVVTLQHNNRLNTVSPPGNDAPALQHFHCISHVSTWPITPDEAVKSAKRCVQTVCIRIFTDQTPFQTFCVKILQITLHTSRQMRQQETKILLTALCGSLFLTKHFKHMKLTSANMLNCC